MQNVDDKVVLSKADILNSNLPLTKDLISRIGKFTKLFNFIIIFLFFRKSSRKSIHLSTLNDHKFVYNLSKDNW